LHDWSALMHGNYLLATWNYLFANWKFGSLVAEYQAAPRDVSIDRMRAAEERIRAGSAAAPFTLSPAR
jgi:hypothetical protein